jgi:cadmium resistance protein CadD (predicted permease)
MWQVAGRACGAFVITNLDDFVLLIAMFSLAAVTPGSAGAVVLGQVIGMAALVVTSVAIAAGLGHFATHYLAILAIVPFAVGVRGFLALRRRGDSSPPRRVITWWSMAALMVASGGDNLTVYSIVFRHMSAADLVLTVACFFAMLGFWLAIAARIGSATRIVRLVQRASTVLTPAIMAVIGLVVLARSGVVGVIVRAT